ncbi:MAG: efflux RND transporter periplasmic adaptor subunit [Patescibacteria group bacterium]
MTIEKTLKILKYKLVWIPIAVVLLGVAGFFVYAQINKPPLETVKVERASIKETVSVTGKVKPAESVDLSFEVGGRVSFLYGKVGTEVYEGQVLSYVSSADTLSNLRGAEADLLSEEARLEELRVGAKPEEISLQEATVSKAKLIFDESKKTLSNYIRYGYTLSDDAIRGKADKFFSNPRVVNPYLNFDIADQSLKREIENARATAERTLLSWQDLLVSSGENIYESSDVVKQYIFSLQNFVDKLSLVINGLEVKSGLTQTTIDTYKSDVYQARTNLNTAFSNVLTAEQSMKTAEVNLEVEEKTLALKKSSASVEDIKSQKALVEKARSTVARYKADLSKKSIISPINGVITKQDLKVGENVAGNVSVISVISESNYEIESFVPEADIEKLEINNEASATLDAYGDEPVFFAVVSKIEPAETQMDGVSTYKTILQFREKNEKIRSGMTANVDITTDSKENVLAVPSRAINYSEKNTFVKIMDENGGTTDVDVQIGIKDENGMVEVTSGVKEGDVLLIER